MMLQRKCALVTGAAMGMGRGIATTMVTIEAAILVHDLEDEAEPPRGWGAHRCPGNPDRQSG